MCDPGGLNVMANEESVLRRSKRPFSVTLQFTSMKGFCSHWAQADGSRGSLAAVLTRLRTARSVVPFPAGAKDFFFSPKRPDWL